MKDPAFLFYSSDFLTGTMMMSMEQKGKYITLLCLQHNKGVLSEKDMIKICGTYDDDVYGKFVKDSNGCFFNERLALEMQKRRAYSESRKNNRTKKDILHISKTYDVHMENINENINEVIDVVIVEDANEKKTVRKKFVQPDENDVYNYMDELNAKAANFMSEAQVLNYARTYMDFYNGNGWIAGRTPMKDWQCTVRNWMRREWEKIKTNTSKNTLQDERAKQHNELEQFRQQYRSQIAKDFGG